MVVHGWRYIRRGRVARQGSENRAGKIEKVTHEHVHSVSVFTYTTEREQGSERVREIFILVTDDERTRHVRWFAINSGAEAEVACESSSMIYVNTPMSLCNDKIERSREISHISPCFTRQVTRCLCRLLREMMRTCIRRGNTFRFDWACPWCQTVEADSYRLSLVCTQKSLQWPQRVGACKTNNSMYASYTRSSSEYLDRLTLLDAWASFPGIRVKGRSSDTVIHLTLTNELRVASEGASVHPRHKIEKWVYNDNLSPKLLSNYKQINS